MRSAVARATSVVPRVQRRADELHLATRPQQPGLDRERRHRHRAQQLDGERRDLIPSPPGVALRAARQQRRPAVRRAAPRASTARGPARWERSGSRRARTGRRHGPVIVARCPRHAATSGGAELSPNLTHDPLPAAGLVGGAHCSRSRVRVTIAPMTAAPSDRLRRTSPPHRHAARPPARPPPRSTSPTASPSRRRTPCSSRTSSSCTSSGRSPASSTSPTASASTIPRRSRACRG